MAIDVRKRLVFRAAGELRRGNPVLIRGHAPLLALAVDTAVRTTLDEFSQLIDGHPIFALPVGAARGPLNRSSRSGMIAGFECANRSDLEVLIEPGSVLRDHDIEFPADIRQRDVPASTAAALKLSCLGWLLPAVMVGSPVPNIEVRAASLGLVAVDADDIEKCTADGGELTLAASADIPSKECEDGRVVVFRHVPSGIEHLAILVGTPSSSVAPLVRVHSQCFTGDVLGSLRCDCGDQLQGAISQIRAERCGAILYLAQEGRGIGLLNKLRAYRLQDGGLDTLDANVALGWDTDVRDFSVAAKMLRALGIQRIRLMTNNPVKVSALAAEHIEVVAREPLVFASNGVNDKYLAAKAERLGHLLS